MGDGFGVFWAGVVGPCYYFRPASSYGGYGMLEKVYKSTTWVLKVCLTLRGCLEMTKVDE